MLVHSCRQGGPFVVIDVTGKGRPGVIWPGVAAGRWGPEESLGLASMQIIQRLRHTLSGQRAHVDGLGVLEKLVNVVWRDGVVGQLLFEPPKPQRREHQ